MPAARTALLGVAGALLVAAPANADDLVIRVKGDAVSAIGGFRPLADPTIGAAVAAFGESTSRKATSEVSCRVRWDAIGLNVTFADLGGGTGAVCGDARAKAQVFGARGPAFATGAGLRIGARTGEIRRRHPGARRHGATWWLRAARSPFGEGRYAILRAATSGGKVTAFRGRIGAAGE